MKKFPLIDAPAIIYQATNRLNGKRYIGATTKTLLDRRQAHIYAAHNAPGKGAFYAAIRKYGVAAFDWETISWHPTAAEAAKLEKRLIASTRPEYNSTPGGDGFQKRAWSKAAREAVSARRKGVVLGPRSYRHPPSVIDKIRLASIGRPGFWTGKQLPPHVCAMMSARMATRPNKERILALGPKAMAKRVVCLNDGKEYESASAAARAYGLDSSQISAVCNKRPNRRSAGGLVFRFYGEHLGGSAEATEIVASVAAVSSANAKKARAKAALRATPSAGKKVRCDNDGLLFDSIAAAARYYGLHHHTVGDICQGKRQWLKPTQLRFTLIEKVGT